MWPLPYLLSIVPFFCLYRLSDVMYVVVYYIIGYRKDIVRTNLQKSFPEKTQQELRSIEKKYYAYLCDLILETFKTLTIRPKNMLERCKMDEATQTLFQNFFKEEKSILLVLGHHGNWEWAGNTVSLLFEEPLYVVYHPISNPFIEQLMVKMRTRFGGRLIAMRDTFRCMLANVKETNLTAFIADQTPPRDHAYWLRFLHQDTPVFEGVEKMAKRFDRPVVYVDIVRIKRGYYQIASKLLETHPATTDTGDITKAHITELEKSIYHQPETWLWSHRRWKHSPPENCVINN